MRTTWYKVASLALILAIVTAMIPGAAGALPDYAADWSTFRGGAQNGVTSALTPEDASHTALSWKTRLKATEDWATNVSDPIIVNDRIYIAVGSEMRIIDPATGAVLQTATLSGPIDFTCRILYTKGMVIVPLSEGVVEALSADTLSPVWTTSALAPDPTGGPHQSQTTLTYSDGLLYRGTACADWTQSYAGVYQAIDVTDGSIVWEHSNDTAGYYWGGGVVVNNAFIFAGDDGALTSVRASDGTTITPVINLDAQARSTIVSSGDKVFAVTTDGVLHSVTVNADGSLGAHTSVAFADSSTSTPVVSGGNIYVGGTSPTWAGVLAVIDANTLAVEQSVDLPATVQGSPIVSTGHTGSTVVYVTANGEPGAVYAFKADDTAAHILYTPVGDEINYCMATPAVGSTGTMYYTNDSGYLFALGRITPADEGDSGAGEGTESGTDTTGSGSAATTTTTTASPSANSATGDGISPALILAAMAAILGVGTALLSRRRSQEESGDRK